MGKDKESKLEKAKQAGAICAKCKHFNPNSHYDCDRYKERLTLADMPRAFCEGFSAKE